MRNSKTGRLGLLVGAIILTLLVLRFHFLPQWVSERIRSHVDVIRDYNVVYTDFEISMLSGSFSLDEVILQKRESKLPIPFFEARKITIAFDFSTLLTDRWSATVTVNDPVLNVIHGQDEVSSLTSISSLWAETIAQIAPLPVNSMEIIDGQIHYNDLQSTPRVILSITEISLKGKNLCNGDGVEKILSGTVEGTGKIAEGRFTMKMELNAFFESPMFSLSAELIDLNLTDVRDFLKAYGTIDVQQGIVSLYTEMMTKNDKVIGFVKPMIEDIVVAGDAAGTSEDSSSNRLWTVASKDHENWNDVSIEGRLDQPGMNLWSATAIALHNAFIEAISATLDTMKKPGGHGKSIPPERTTPARTTVEEKSTKKGFLKRIFNKKDEKRKRKTDD